MRPKHFFIMILLTVTFLSCSKDENDSITGQWNFIDVEYNGLINDGMGGLSFEGDVFDIQGGVSINENGEYTGNSQFSVHLILDSGEIDDTLINVPFYFGGNGYWSINNDEITLDDNGETDTYTFNLTNNGNTLSITGADFRVTSTGRGVIVDNATYIYDRE